MVLFTLAICLVLIGILYSTTVSAHSPKLIGTLGESILLRSSASILLGCTLNPLQVSGFGTFVLFGLWETFAKLKQPLTPTRIWTRDYGREFTAPFVVGFVVTM